MGRGPVVIAIWFMGPSGIGIAGQVFRAGKKRRGNKDGLHSLPALAREASVGWAGLHGSGNVVMVGGACIGATGHVVLGVIEG